MEYRISLVKPKFERFKTLGDLYPGNVFIVDNTTYIKLMSESQSPSIISTSLCADINTGRCILFKNKMKIIHPEMNIEISYNDGKQREKP